MCYQDLNQDDVMVLDAGEEIYIWVGKESSKEEQEKASAMAEVQILAILACSQED